MKPMSDRKMGIGGGAVDSDGYFPSEPQHKKLPRAGEIRGFDYPDTEAQVLADTNQAISNTSKNMPKTGFRH